MSEAEPDEPREGPLCDCCHRVLIYDDGVVFHVTYAAQTDPVAMDELISILAKLPDPSKDLNRDGPTGLCPLNGRFAQSLGRKET